MTQDLLKSATKALSESGHEQQGARFTRERLMASLHEKNRCKKSHFAVFLPLAAIFVGSTAFAAVSGKLDVFVMSVLQVVGARAADAPVEATLSTVPAAPVGGRRVAPVSRAASQPAVLPQVEPTVAAPDSKATEAPRRLEATPLRRGEGTRVPRVSRSPEAGSTRPVTSDVDAAQSVYRSAHDAHFKAGRLSQALAGYEDYLARKPAGRFAVDARYNRALCLVRLGRRAEARPILERFASGTFGGYRSADAQKLLEALDEASGGDAP
jgi:hypothetical protein